MTESKQTLTTHTIESLKEKYLETLSQKEKKSYLIAKEHLGMSFQLEKSLSFIKWKKTYQE
jgi:hypothetical protein